jgi:SPP1 gp7 family putative phage head morphogenesis protein
MPFKAPADPKRYAEAVRWFRQRVPVTPTQFEKLTEDAKRQSFTVAGTKQLRVVQAVYDEVARSVERGEHGDEAFGKFKARLRERLNADYVDKNSAALRAAWSGSTQTALNTGRWEQQSLADRTKFPFRRFVAIRDHKTSEGCLALHGTMRRTDDGFWLTCWPPRHPHCRSAVQLVAAGKGQRATPIPRVDTAPGWGEAPPLRADWEPDPADFDPKLFRTYKQKLARLRKAHAAQQ